MQQIKLCTTEVPNVRAVYELLTSNQDNPQHVHVLHICMKIYRNVSIILVFQNKEELSYKNLFFDRKSKPQTRKKT
jgi:hypothetical protein